MELDKEKELIGRLKNDPEAFSELYEQNYSKIFGYILKRVANLEIAQDITSETFFKSLNNIKKFRWQNVSFSCWLYRIASNEIANYFRKNKYKPVSFEKICEPVSFSNPSEEIIEAEEKLKEQKEFLKIHQKLLKLPAPYQEVIVLRFFEKNKINEIAEILGKKEGTIKSLLHRGLEKLKELVKREPF